MTNQHTIQYLRRLGTAALISGLGCSSPDLSGPVSTDPTQLYWAIRLSARAITMDTLAPYDTLQLTATPRTVSGVPLAGAPAPTFTTSDSSVRVSATGLLTARSVSSNVQVIATLTYRGIRLADTAIVNVTASASPQPFDHLAFGLMTGDSIAMAAPTPLSFIYYPPSKTLQADALDATGASIPGTLIALRTSDSLQATVGPQNTVTAVVSAGTVDVSPTPNISRAGPVTVYASATVYGVTREDSVQLVITPPLFVYYQLAQQPVSGSSTFVSVLTPSLPQTIGVGGVIWWVNAASDSMDIIFDNPAAAGAEEGSFDTGTGNIPALPACGFNDGCGNIAARRFPHAGTVHFHSPRAGVSGTIIVQ